MKHSNGLFIDTEHVRGWSNVRIVDELSRVFASTAFAYSEETGRVGLHGSRRDHLKIDPEFNEVCESAGIALESETFHSTCGSINICLEDGLSGLFISRAIFDEAQEDWVIVHLDDHADMMPTLLVKDDYGGLRDPETGKPFRAHTETDWFIALERGTVTIGSYLTPLFHDKPSGSRLHIRHLRPSLEIGSCNDIFDVSATTKTYPILGPTRFAAVDFNRSSLQPAGTYMQSDCVADAFSALPSGRVIVHIDLDFFVNDFNGNLGTKPTELGECGQAAVLTQMDCVFEGIAQLEAPIERWIIATSPGFCAARHWEWLLDALNSRIGTLTGEEGQLFLG